MPERAKRSPEEIERARKWKSLDLETHPPTITAADGETELRRFEVSGLVYARDMSYALQSCSEWNLGPYLGAVRLGEVGSELIPPADHAERLAVVKRFSGFHIGSEGWGEEILEVYNQHPEDARAQLEEEEK